MRFLSLALVVACSGSNPSSPPPAPPPPGVAAADATPAVPAREQFAPLPYTADQIRAGSPAGRVIPFRLEVPGKPTSMQVITFVSSDDQGAEIEVAHRDDKGRPTGDAKRQRATWGELAQHGAFPRAATTIEEGVADTPAGKFPSKIYIVKQGDEVSHFYFAVDRPGPPVLAYTEKAGTRTMTSTLLASADVAAAPVACKTDDDCWLDGNKPIARPRSERGKKLKPCKDSERLPACKENVCSIRAYKC
jgi:hypothetical protein